VLALRGADTGSAAFLTAGLGVGVAGRAVSAGFSVRRGSTLAGAGFGSGTGFGVGTTSCGGAAAGAGAALRVAMPAACRANRLTAAGSPLAAAAIAAM